MANKSIKTPITGGSGQIKTSTKMKQAKGKTVDPTQEKKLRRGK